MNHTFYEKGRNLPILDKVDVVVVGGGPAGLIAAIASARNKASTLLIERFGFLGGMAATGLPLHAFIAADGTRVIKGIPQEVVDRLIRNKGSPGHMPGKIVSKTMRGSTAPIDPEVFKQVALEMLEEANSKILLYTLAVDGIVQRNIVKGVILENKSGRQAVLAKVVIDASGDGDIAARCGASFEKGRKEDGLMQPPSLMFTLANVDTEKSDSFPKDKLFQLTKEANQKGELPAPVNQLWYFTIQKGVVAVNGTRVNRIDGTQALDLTQAEIELRKQIPKVVSFLKRYVSGFESSVLVGTGPIIGVRETRRIIGEYVLTGEDVLQARQFEDQIAKSGYFLDIHNPNGAGVQRAYIKGGASYGIPYRCLIPKKIDNLVVAGRCISTTFEAHASTRVMGPCMAIGQAAGTAAALAVREGVPPRKLEAEKLRQTLLEQGAIV
ncbi:MAG: FAD-dependent oxidoreductase [Nitrososphaeria archaeon]